jgi:hypothetical protein
VVDSSASSKIILKNQWQYALVSIALFGASIFGLYITYDTAVQFSTDFTNRSDIILVPYGYISLIGASIVAIWFAVVLVYEKVLIKSVESGIIRITKFVFITGFILMVSLPILFKIMSEVRLNEIGYTKCNTYESRGTNKWVIDKNLC